VRSATTGRHRIFVRLYSLPEKRDTHQVVRTRQINDGTQFSTSKEKQYSNFWRSLAKVVHEEGLVGCWWPGMTAAWCREAVYGSLKLGLYPSIRDVMGGQKAEQSSLLVKILSSAITGAVAQGLSSPLDLVKMQLQADSGRTGPDGLFVTGLRKGKPRGVHGVWDALVQVYRKEGVRGLWRGMLANIARSTLLVCGQLTGYDESKYLLLKFAVMRDGPALHLVAGVVSAVRCTNAFPCITQGNRPTHMQL
jgi:hypothetical protein